MPIWARGRSVFFPFSPFSASVTPSLYIMRTSPPTNCFSTTRHSRLLKSPITVEVESKRSTTNWSPLPRSSSGGGCPQFT